MNLQELSKKLLEEAVREGSITLENGEVRLLSNVQLISIIKYVLGEGIQGEGDVDTLKIHKSIVPSEMCADKTFSELDECSSNESYRRVLDDEWILRVPNKDDEDVLLIDLDDKE